MENKKNIDLLGIGNAITDILVKVDYSFLEKLNLNVGAMQLTDYETINNTISLFKDMKVSAGGSVANTISMVAKLGNRCAFIGRRKNDTHGKLFTESMSNSNILLPNSEVEQGEASSTCLVMITPNGERTMLTYLGASTNLTEEDIDLSLIKKSKIVYLEGYLFDLPEAKKLFFGLADKQQDLGFEFALSLSDPFCVTRHKEDFLKLLDKKVKIVFSNQEEIETLFSCSVEKALLNSSDKILINISTLGEKGAMVYSNGNLIKKNSFSVEVKDTTGAGDSFAAGFLHGYVNNFPLDKCAEVGNFCASETVKVIGARPEVNVKEMLLKNNIL